MRRLCLDIETTDDDDFPWMDLLSLLHQEVLSAYAPGEPEREDGWSGPFVTNVRRII
jgi:hypothetical protein